MPVKPAYLPSKDSTNCISTVYIVPYLFAPYIFLKYHPFQNNNSSNQFILTLIVVAFTILVYAITGGAFLAYLLN